MHLFYAPELNAAEFSLPEEETHHLIHVLRLSQGEKVEVTDGRGTLAVCEVAQLSKKSAVLQTLTIEHLPQPARRLQMAIAPTKNMDRMEWFVEKATEIGVSRITPLLCKHSERKVLNTDRLRKLVIAAAKQSRQFWFPTLDELCPFDAFIHQENSGIKYIAHCHPGPKAPLSSIAKEDVVTILIGPEGDFNMAEVEMAMKKGFHSISLGESRLRTETAALVAVVAFNIS